MSGPDSPAADRDGPPVRPDPAGPAQENQVMIEVQARSGITTSGVRLSRRFNHNASR